MPPCLTMKVKMLRRQNLVNYIGEANLILHPQHEVKVFKDIYSYDAVNLVVDLGSALGLWLGLSALGIFDYIILFIGFAKSKYNH